MSNIFEELTQRGYTEQLTHPEEIKNLLDNESISFYIGFDPTADSLHVGHFISLMVASHMQKAGHKPIILMGGGTAIIGDPSGKTDMRKMLTVEDIDNNVAQIKKQIEKFLSFEGPNAAIIVNNGDWLRDLNYINFMREIGVHFSVNRMLAAECYKNRLETGLTFFELGYMLMQSYDFLYLHDHYGCKLEMGGNDQWSNIIGGVELIRKIGAEDAYGFTFKLLTTKEGKKMGKTEKGALWLNPEKTSPYEFYQYWRNVADDDIENVDEPDYPFIYVIFDTARQIALIKLKTSVFSSLNQAKEKLKVCFQKTFTLFGFEVFFEEITDSSTFWNFVSDSYGVYDLTLTLNSPNLFGGFSNTNEMLKTIKETYNNSQTTIKLSSKNPNITNLTQQNTLLNDAIDYASAGGGEWSLTVAATDKEKRTIKSKHNVRKVSVRKIHPKQDQKDIEDDIRKALDRVETLLKETRK